MKFNGNFMIFNNKRCKKLTPTFLEKINGLYLHQFKWIKKDQEIGNLPKRWNVLIGEQKSIFVRFYSFTRNRKKPL